METLTFIPYDEVDDGVREYFIEFDKQVFL